MSACHCSPCGRDFTSLSGFDKHRDWDYKKRPGLVCRDPAELGMELDRFGRWHFPADASERARRQNLSAEQPPPGVSGYKPGTEAENLDRP